MKISGNIRQKSALLLSSTVGLALALAGCTSVEYSAKPETESPKIAAVTPAVPQGPEASTTQVVTQAATGQTPSPVTAGATQATPQVVANATPESLPSAAAVKGGRVALPPASEIAAAAAISAQLQTTQPGVQLAMATPAASNPAAPSAAVTAVAANVPATSAKAGGTLALPQVVAVKGSFPPAPPPPGMPSSAPVQLTEEMVREQTIVPMPKPSTTMLAYASAPQNAALAAISTREAVEPSPGGPVLAGREKLSGLISKYASMYNVPEDLVHRVVQRESRYNPSAYNGGHFGLMQIKHATARSMGFNGPAKGLFDAETNLKYAVKYLSGAWKVSESDRDGAVRLYARGYYYDAKKKGMLHVLRQ